MWSNFFRWIIKNYTLCSKDDFDKFLSALQKKCDAEIQNCKEIVDANNDGKISVYECWAILKHIYKILKIEVLAWVKTLQ